MSFDERRMCKVINGKKYDTATAEHIDFCGRKIPTGHFYWHAGYGKEIMAYFDETTLFKKKTGEYFATFRSSNYGSENMLVPLDDEGVEKWFNEYGHGDAYIEEFGEVEE